MTRRNNIYIAVLIIACLFGIYKFGVSFAPGSYSSAEEFMLNANEKDVIDVINQYKIDHPEISVPKVQIENQGQFDLPDGKDSSSHWYTFYFYYKKENQIIFTWTRPNGNQKTTFAFIAINNGLNIGNWKVINRDFSSNEDQMNKEKFKSQILDSIIERLRLHKN